MNESKPKFTPGPWRVHLDKRNGSACSIIEDKTGDCVARTVYRFHRGERNANASLIAAAPEMYEILDQLTRIGGGVGGLLRLMRLQNEAEELLKKARGEK